MSRKQTREEPELTLYVTSPTFIRDHLNDQISNMRSTNNSRKEDSKTNWDSDEEPREERKRANKSKIVSVRAIRPSDYDEEPTPIEPELPATSRRIELVEEVSTLPAKQKKIQMPLSKSQFVRKQYKELLPSKYVLAHGAALTILGLLAIGFQVGLMLLKYGFYYFGAGFWIGFFYWILLLLLLIFYRFTSLKLYYFILAFHLLGTFLSLGLFTLNLITFIYDAYKCSNSTSTSSSGTTTTTANPLSEYCKTSYAYLNITLMLVGLLGFIVNIVYVFISYCIFSFFFKKQLDDFEDEA